MNRKIIFITLGFIILAFSLKTILTPKNDYKAFQETTRVALRDVGHKLLLASQDSTSVVLPIQALETFKFRLTFQNDITIQPDSLVSIVENSLQKANVSDAYLVEVTACETNDVSYSYEMFKGNEKGIIPCLGRNLPKNCYYIDVRFTHKHSKDSKILYYVLAIIGGVLIFPGIIKNVINQNQSIASEENFKAIGSFKFYPNQNKLVMHAEEINLSKKECELLELFVTKPNQIIKRDELTKTVWEDHGVFVGRSLDTYISKLRKKLKKDSSIKISNVHGVGYKLEVVS